MSLKLQGKVLNAEVFTAKKSQKELISVKVFDGRDVYDLLGGYDKLSHIEIDQAYTFGVSASVRDGNIAYWCSEAN